MGQNSISRVFVLCGLLAISACSRASSGDQGAVRIAVQALQISDIAELKVTITATEMPTPLVVPLVRFC